MAEPLSLGQLGRVLFRYWILILVGTLVGGALAFGVTRFMTPVYRATAIQLVKGLPGTGAAANYEAAQYAVNRAKTYPSFVHSQEVLDGVRNDLGNAESVEQLRLDLSATNPLDTPLLEVSATGETPQEARDKANYAARHMARFITEIETVGNKSPIIVETAVLAALPASAASPKTLVIVALGAMVGFALTTIFAMINSYVRYRRRAAFRRKQAIGWITAESAEVPAATAAAAAPSPPPKVGPSTAAEAAPPVPAHDGLPTIVVTAPQSESQVEASADSAEASASTAVDSEVPAERDGGPTEAVAKAGFEPDDFLFEVDPDPTTIVERPAAAPGDSAEDTDHEMVSSVVDTDHDAVGSVEEVNHHAVDSVEELNHHAVDSVEKVNHHLVKLEDHNGAAGLDEIELVDLDDSAEDTVRLPDERDEMDVLEHSGTRKQSAPR